MAAGKLEDIWLKTAHGGPMQKVSAASLLKGKGIKDSADFAADVRSQSLKKKTGICCAPRWGRIWIHRCDGPT